jgi:NADH dehydrogenase FAD-containing subunit
MTVSVVIVGAGSAALATVATVKDSNPITTN